MFVKMFIKPQFIAFYEEENIYKTLLEIYKKNKIVSSEKKEFETLKDLKKYINAQIEENPQTYVSTFIRTQNQGSVHSCEKQVYKAIGIDIDNIQSVCIKNSYSFYTTIYEIMQTKKNYPFIDFIYPAFAIIDFNANNKNDALYILTTKEYSYILIYKENLPYYSDVVEILEDEELLSPVEENDEIVDISDMDIIEEEYDNSLDENIEDIEEINPDEDEVKTDESIEHLNLEYKILNQIKEALKEYYDNGGDFIQNIYIHDTVGLHKDVTKIIKDELFIEATMQNTDILKTLNQISRTNV